MQQATEAQIKSALEAIAASHPEADVLTEGVAEHYAVAHPGSLLVYLNARPREELRKGDVYLTWVVTFFRGEPTEVAYFRSRACSDETLPP